MKGVRSDPVVRWQWFTLLVGGSTSPVLHVLSSLWPVVVLAFGLWLLLRAWREGSTDRSRDASYPR